MKRIGSISVIFLAFFAVPLWAAEFHVDRETKNRVIFLSHAPLDDFEGITDDIDGYVLWDGTDTPVTEAPLHNSEFHFEVTLDGLDTGIGLRNRHMRENYLETEQYPTVSYTGRIAEVQRQTDSVYTISITGVFTLHGVEQARTIIVKAESVNNGYHIKSEFVVKLEEYKIKVPRLMFLKIDPNIRISLDFYLKVVEEED